MDQIDLTGDVGQIQGFFDRGIAAADDRYVLVAEKETVTGGAGGHAFAHEFLLGFECPGIWHWRRSR